MKQYKNTIKTMRNTGNTSTHINKTPTKYQNYYYYYYYCITKLYQNNNPCTDNYYGTV